MLEFSKLLIVASKTSTLCFLYSNYLTQLRSGYARATKEESVPATSITEPPPYHLGVIPPNAEQNNNLKSVETE